VNPRLLAAAPLGAIALAALAPAGAMPPVRRCSQLAYDQRATGLEPGVWISGAAVITGAIFFAYDAQPGPAAAFAVLEATSLGPYLSFTVALNCDVKSYSALAGDRWVAHPFKTRGEARAWRAAAIRGHLFLLGLNFVTSGAMLPFAHGPAARIALGLSTAFPLVWTLANRSKLSPHRQIDESLPPEPENAPQISVAPSGLALRFRFYDGRQGIKMATQLSFRKLHGWGGKRPGAGRKPVRVHARVPHASRESPRARFPVHVTIRFAPHVWSLRARRCFRVVERAIAKGRERFGFRAVEFSVLGNHIHLIAEAGDNVALGRGMKGLEVRLARGLNKVMRRKGAAVAERYHARLLKTPRQVRNALLYVLGNACRHFGGTGIDHLSSAPSFFGLRAPLTAAPRTWLLRAGWARHGRIDPADLSAPAAARGPGRGRSTPASTPPRRRASPPASPRTLRTRRRGR